MFWLIPTSAIVLGGAGWIAAANNPVSPIVNGAVQAYRDRQLARGAINAVRAQQPQSKESFIAYLMCP